MRILQLHCDNIEYTPTAKENTLAEDIQDKSTQHIDNLVVAFAAVEKGDNQETAQEAISQITVSMKRIGCTRLLLYPYAHLSSELARPKEALDVLIHMEKTAISNTNLEVWRAPFGWTKSYHIKVKGHPLAESSKVIRTKPKQETDDGHTSEALVHEAKIESHWKILSTDGTITDVSSFDFTNHKKLEVLAKYEAEKQRHVDEPSPHVALMKRLAIADYESASDSGNMRFFPNGRLIKSLIERHITDKVREYGGYEVETPIMYDSAHPSMVSYFNRFPARQYSIDSEGKKLFLRFAACFGQFLMANQFQMSYKNLPYKLYELTRYSFRREQSGELVGLRRLRAFTMPDCHAFCSDMNQVVKELNLRFDLSRRVLGDLDIHPPDYEMAIRFTEEFYNENRDMINGLVRKHGKPVLVEMWKRRFFYFVFKWEFNFVDGHGKASALSTDQVDVENGKRYGIQFVDESNMQAHPIILHNSPSGAVERIMYVLLEKAAADSKIGKRPNLPFWLCPTQIRIIPIKEEFHKIAESLADTISAKSSARIDIDDRNESIGKRIREAEREWIPYILVIGAKESGSDTLSIRDRQTGNLHELSHEDFVNEIKSRMGGMPTAGLNLPLLLSKRPQLMV